MKIRRVPFPPTPHISRLAPVRAALLALCLAAPLLAGCGFHNGGDALAFIRAGQLWSIQPDGTNALKLVDADVVSLTWSPDHHQLALRLEAPPAPNLPPPASTLGAREAPSAIAAESINGGLALQLSPASTGLVRGDPWWNPSGNRLIYSERFPGAQPPVWIVSQADQPAGIARKPLLDDASIPVLSADGNQVAVIDTAGNVRLGKPGATGTVVASGALLTLPGSGRPGRILWQPRASALLYATAGPVGVALVLHPLAGTPRTVASTAVALDYAFSPDGLQLLVRTPQAFELWSLSGDTTPLFTWPESDPLALPWWSPDGRTLLVQDDHGWQLVNPAGRAVKSLLAYRSPPAQPLSADVLWHPVSASPWSPDGMLVVFVSVTGDTWQGAALPTPKGSAEGLYVAPLSASRIGQPALIDSGDDRAPSWSAVDPSTAYLVAG
jgi:hypothetical protein